MRTREVTIDAEKAQRAAVIRDQLEDVEAYDGFLFIGVESDGHSITAVDLTGHGDVNLLITSLEDVLADLRGGFVRPH